MKVIKLTESQFRRLLESDNSVPSFDGGDVTEYNSGEKVTNSASVHDTDGNVEFGKQPDTDDVANQLSAQQWYANGTTNNNHALNY